eukprot:CAMPEP_0202688612 /NCGR_PEP_ID=MMETSP1385-20130828/4105_1 /ASSEMBLY_ACC=CAM_ASM_000861 /TAXON_ID=933848 /ORGANISM="Elphidium margaritaceum" /LENGTH=767 /DNA_ID=CAMNT_0049343627 /DNA_START=31 /DNA_END=2334 /DNA_ORIENTATION=+
MASKITLFVMVLLAYTSIPTTSADREMTKSEVKMNLDEFEEIFSSARLNEAEQRVREQEQRHAAEHQRKLKELDEAIVRAKTKTEHARIADHLALFPDNYKVLTQRADGLFNASAPSSGVEGDVASFDIELMIRIMSPKWTTIPIANTSSIVASDWKLSWMHNSTDNSTNYMQVDPFTDPEAMFLIRDDQMVLATNRTGLFRVGFTAYSRVRKDRKLNSVSLSSLLYPLSGASTIRLCAGMRRNRINTMASGSPSAHKRFAVKELSINPASAVLKVLSPDEAANDDGCAKIQLILPLTANKFEIRWLDINMIDAAKEQTTLKADREDDGIRAQDAEDSLITVSHDVMHTVEEGVVRSTNILQFKTSGDTLSSVAFMVRGGRGTRVTSVAGYGLARWTTGAYNATESVLPVYAYFKSSNLDSAMTLQVDTESDTDTAAKQQTLELPRIECMGVLRQSGRIGVIKHANNVELHQSKAVGLARAEPSEIASQLRLNTDRPIFLAYKYLNPNYQLHLSSTAHAAMDTLEAVADRVHYRVLVMESHVMHSLLVMMKSTKLQYLEIRGIPAEASMFTLIVNGVQTKPVRGGDGDDALLIPLLVGLNTEMANDGLGVKSSIELRYFVTHDALGVGEQGSLELQLPRVTLPISVVTVELRLPKSHAYNFTGDFGRNGSDTLKYPVPSAFTYVKGKRVVRKDYKFSHLDDVVEESGKDSAIQMNIPKSGSGQPYFFSRLLVVDTKLSLRVEYFPPPATPTASTLLDNFKSFLGVNG